MDASDSYIDPNAKIMRPKTLVERQPYFLAYGVGISLFSPFANIYMISKLNPQVSATNARMVSLAAKAFPLHTVLKAIVLNIATKVKDYLNPVASFAALGIIQCGLYGQWNIYFSKQLGLAREAKFSGMFRGVGYAAGRDAISQGIPFMCASLVEKHIIETVFPSDAHTSKTSLQAKKWGALLSTSAVCTFGSQFFHNCQITMLAHQNFTYREAMKHVVDRNGVSALYKGGEARVGVLIVANVLNDLLLKPAWTEVELLELEKTV